MPTESSDCLLVFLELGDFGSAALVVEIMDVSAFCVVVGDVGAAVDAADFRGIFEAVRRLYIWFAAHGLTLRCGRLYAVFCLGEGVE
jgi:hypothetical protein